MENNKKELNKQELGKVTGGTHLSPENVKELKAGQLLIIEGLYNYNVALAEYLGEWRDPGIGSMLQLKVRIIEIYDQVWRKGDTLSAVTGGVRLQPGDVIYASRWNLDYPEKA